YGLEVIALWRYKAQAESCQTARGHDLLFTSITMPSSTLAMYLALTALTLCPSIAQELSSSDTFVLYPYITSGELPDPYPNSAIDKSQPLASSSGRPSGSYTSDCFNKFVFTSYIGTHCSAGTDQCGFKRWSLNGTDSECFTATSYIAGMSDMIIAGLDEADENGGRDVGGRIPGMRNVRVKSSEDGILNLVYENKDDPTDVFGTFYTCWREDIYGPRLFYRNADGTTPEGCAELMLVPRCNSDASLADAPINAQCYQGGLPA
ncbi:hypothetical protein HII31_06787, partial [Pseudocercospora fuligena]